MIKAGVVGGTGYTGVELLRLLVAHPEVDLGVITSRSEAGRPVADMFPNLRGCTGLEFSAPDAAQLESCDLVFFAPCDSCVARLPTRLRWTICSRQVTM